MAGFVTLVRRANLRHLARHKLRTLLTTIGVAAGVALVFSIAVINSSLLSSFRSSIKDLAGSAEIEVASADQTGIPHDFVDRILELNGVAGAVPVTRSTTTVVGPSGSERIVVLGITPEFTSLFPRGLGSLADVRISGGFSTDRDVILARGVAESIGARRDDTIVAETPEGAARLTTSGVISGGALAVFNGGDVGIMLLQGAQKAFDRPGLVDSIYVVIEDRVSIADLAAGIDEAIGGGAIVGPPGERGAGIERVFAGLASLLSLAGTVSLFVALFVVFNTMSMSLAERRREMAMAMALGAERRQVFGAFMGEAAVFGIIASALGIGGGLVLARVLVQRAIEGYEMFPVQAGGPIVVQPSHALLAGICGVGVSLLGAYLPARRILGVAPVEGLRPDASYEWSRATTTGSNGVRVIVGIGATAIGVGAFVATGAYPAAEWIVQVGLVAGLTGVTLLLPYIVPFAVRVARPVMTRMFGTVGRLSADALAKNPGRTTFTVAALVLTLGLVIGVGSALASYKAQIDRQATALIGAPLYVTARSFSGITSDQPLPGELRADLEAIEGVEFVYPLRFLFLNVDGQQGLLFAIAVEDALEHGAESVMTAITHDPGGFLETLSSGELAVSVGTAERHGLQVGDELPLHTPSGEHRFTVGATYNDLVSFDSLYLDYGTYRELWKDDSADQFGLLLEPGATIADVARRARALVAETGVAARVLTKEEVVGRLLNTIEGTFSMGQGIQLAALVVAAITIANTLFTAVLERRWEMGLQRAIGMGGRQLSRSVLLEAAGIGVIGGIGGALLGTAAGMLMLGSMEAQFAWDVPYQLPWELWLLAIGGGAALAGTVGVIPSRLAARTSIIESLRYE
jgi:putative ABC transport system permease protein